MNSLEMAFKRPFPEGKVKFRKGGGSKELA